ncbi:hypothetical protein K402DRAFT_302375, partial [Aulographum hederae CBS 113979]
MGPLGKLHNHVVHIRRSANRTTWFRDRAGKIIPLDNSTRWNSWFTMLNVALEDRVKAALQLYVEQYRDDISEDDILTTSEWIHLPARVLDPQCRTAFTKDENEDVTVEGEKKLYVVRKFWERF